MTLRRHAAGSFADLLRAMIRDPAMLAWLDNHTSNQRRQREPRARDPRTLRARPRQLHRDRHQGGRTGPYRLHLRGQRLRLPARMARPQPQAPLPHQQPLRRRLVHRPHPPAARVRHLRRARALPLLRRQRRAAAARRRGRRDQTRCRRAGRHAAIDELRHPPRAHAPVPLTPFLRESRPRRGIRHAHQVAGRGRRRRSPHAAHARTRRAPAARGDGPQRAGPLLPSDRRRMGRRARVDQHLHAAHARTRSCCCSRA